jgi:zinc/manganese transport system substrate-binding protein
MAIAMVVLAALAGAGCGAGGGSAGSGPAIVVTTNILGDVVRQLVGDDATVEVVMPPGSSPHDFAPSARQVADMRDADVLVVNGLGFEAGLDDTIAAAAQDGADVIRVASLAPRLLDLDAGGHRATDPHVFTDPARMAEATGRLAGELGRRVEGLDSAAYRRRSVGYVSRLRALDAEVEAILRPIPPTRRVLVTNHEVLGYFADRYGFRVLGTVIPSLSTASEPSAAALAHLADAIDAAGVPAIFAETSSPRRLAQALAGEGTSVQVVQLFGESLGRAHSGAVTYVEMVRTNARRIAAALA